MLLALAALALALPGYAQNVQSPSDSYLCNHGDQTAAATEAACARLRGGAAAPATPPGPQSTSPDATPRAVAPSSATAVVPAANDVGETPDEASAGVPNNQGPDQDDDQARVSVHGSWLPYLGPMAIVAVILGGFIGMAFYFLPTIIALARRKRNAVAILVLNFFLGWTFIGWVAALVWSLATEPGR
jgi:hypothetical protein